MCVCVCACVVQGYPTDMGQAWPGKQKRMFLLALCDSIFEFVTHQIPVVFHLQLGWMLTHSQGWVCPEKRALQWTDLWCCYFPSTLRSRASSTAASYTPVASPEADVDPRAQEGPEDTMKKSGTENLVHNHLHWIVVGGSTTRKLENCALRTRSTNKVRKQSSDYAVAGSNLGPAPGELGQPLRSSQVSHTQNETVEFDEKKSTQKLGAACQSLAGEMPIERNRALWARRHKGSCEYERRDRI